MTLRAEAQDQCAKQHLVSRGQEDRHSEERRSARSVGEGHAPCKPSHEPYETPVVEGVVDLCVQPAEFGLNDGGLRLSVKSRA